jgi:AraC-like DNA-binding protein
MKLLFCVAQGRMGTREPCARRGYAPVLPVPLAPYEAYLGTRLQRDSQHRVLFTLADTTRPFLTSNEALWGAFEPTLRQRLADLDASTTTTQRIRAALLEGLPSGQVAMQQIASKLALSLRTLQRHMEAEGTSYQQILQQTREALARHYLTQTTLPVAEISFLPGFAEINSFYRAFRLWTGTTPDAVRHVP